MTAWKQNQACLTMKLNVLAACVLDYVNKQSMTDFPKAATTHFKKTFNIQGSLHETIKIHCYSHASTTSALLTCS